MIGSREPRIVTTSETVTPGRRYGSADSAWYEGGRNLTRYGNWVPSETT
jgi:hypothetical protein